MPDIKFVDPEQQALILDTWKKIETAMVGLQKIIEDLPEDVRDPLLAMLLSQHEATPRMVDAYNKFISFYEEVRGLGAKDEKGNHVPRYPFLEKILLTRFIRPKQRMLLAMQKIITRLKHALEEAPQDPKALREWERTHAPHTVFDITGATAKEVTDEE